MTTDISTDETRSTDSPQPTAHELEHVDLDKNGLAEDGLPIGRFLEADASRRDVLRGLGAAGTATVGGSAIGATGAAAEEDGDTEDDDHETPDWHYDPEGDAPTAMTTAGQAYWVDDDIAEPEADETILHSTAVSERESYDAHLTTLGNHIEDMSTIASLEARNEIANSWEDNESQTSGYSNTLSRIRDYYAEPHEKNHYELTNKALTQLSHLAHTAQADDDVEDDFIAFFVDNSSHPDEELAMATLTNERVETEFELHNGDTITMESPELYVQTESGDGEFRGPLSAEIIDSWDSEEETFELEADDGETWETSLNFTVMSVGDPEDGGLESETVFWGAEFAGLLEEIEDQSDRVTGNYSEDFVEDLYAELDDGNIEPSDIRGAEGNARFLAGTDDASSDALRMALLQQLNMEQADLSEVASMTITYSGYTAQETREADDEIYRAPSDWVQDRTMEGFFQARELPDSGLSTDQTYAAGTTSHVVVYDSGYMCLLDPVNDEIIWEYDPNHGGSLEGFEVGLRSGVSFGAYASTDNTYAIDLWTGEELWTDSTGSRPYAAAEISETEVVLTDGDLRKLSIETGDELETIPYSHGSPEELVYYDDMLVLGDVTEDLVAAIDPESGNELWTFETENSPTVHRLL